jgi:transcriptional regulator with XRE-family HTH domain
MAQDGDRQSRQATLGQYLGQLRAIAGFSLRQVEEITKKEVSNAYLSQLENDKIGKPSPNILHALAQTYGVSYEDLMARAGYFRAENAVGSRQARVATFAVDDLTSEEEEALRKYLAFLRHDRKRT